MQIVIDIDEEARENFLKRGMGKEVIAQAIEKGKPLSKAKWQKKKIGYESTDIYAEWQMAQCSNCKEWHTTPYMYYFYEYKYCPFCGAKMEIEE